MNLATILTAIPVAALIVWALVKTVRSRGRCSGCQGSCSLCRGCGEQDNGGGGVKDEGATDPFYPKKNIDQIKKADSQVKAGNAVIESMEEMEAIANG